MSVPYVINLDKNPERWERIQSVWRGVFPVQRVQAIEASPGWVGCALSHIKVIEEAKARGDPYVLAWEDDCVPRKRNGEYSNPRVIKRMWDTALQKLDSNRSQWDIVIGATSTVFESPTQINSLSTPLVRVYRLNKGFTTHWTLYNACCYDRMIAWKEKRATPIDVHMYETNRVFVTVPFLAEQHSGFSAIENRETNYESMFNNAEKQFRPASVVDALPKVPLMKFLSR
jgi:hypothetical protein